mgnify:CR=1 FL=1
MTYRRPYTRGRMPPIASVDVPASSANLGSGFDCFAAALSLKLRAELWPGDEAGITLNARGEGVPRDGDPADDNLLITGPVAFLGAALSGWILRPSAALAANTSMFL